MSLGVILHERHGGKGSHDATAVEKRRALGYICAHVDDFLISGDETSEQWADALQVFYSRFTWSPWKFHSGVEIREEPDFSYTLDHSSFCENFEQITFKARLDHEPVNEEEMSQLRGALGALQCGAHQTGPRLSARLGQLQSEIARANSKLDTCQLGSTKLEYRIQVRFVLWHGAMRL